MELRGQPVSVVAFGAVLFLAATTHHALEVRSIGEVGPPLVAWLVDGGLAAGVVLSGWRLRDADLSSSEYGTVRRWTVAGAVAGGVLIGMTFLVRLFEGRPLSEPAFPLLVGTNGGALLATIAGYYAARSMATARRFEEIFNNTYQLTGLLALDGTILEANDTALSFGGLDRGDVVGERLQDSYWVEPYEESQRVVEAAIAEARAGELYRDRIRIQGETGSGVIDFSVRPMYDEAGEPVRLIVEGRDVTEVRRQQEHLNVLHRYLRHNLRNGLNTIQGYAALLLDRQTEDPDAERVETIHRTATELIDSSELVKEFSERTAEKRDEVGARRLGPIVTAACDRASVPAERLDVELDAELTVRVDDRIRLAFAEFLGAVGDHLDGGEIGIAAERTADSVDVTISCLGFEIPAAELSAFDRATERSSTHHPHGIRFWLLKSVVRECGGSVAYDDRRADGTVVTLSLEPGSTEPESPAPPPRGPTG